MSILVMNGSGNTKIIQKKFELVKLNGKYYIELDEFEDADSIIELSISLATENDLLRERINIQAERIKMLENAI